MADGSEPPSAPRIHGLDALRASMMLLGVFLHSATSYMTHAPAEWRFHDQDTSLFFDVSGYVIHMFRMPAFFLVAGFFVALLTLQRGAQGMLHNRIQRVVLPLLVFWLPCQAGNTIASAWAARVPMQAGLETLRTFLPWNSQTLPGALGHLWFLYDLTIFCAVAAAVSVVTRGSTWPSMVARQLTRLLTRRGGVFILALPSVVVLFFQPFALVADRASWLPDGVSQLANGLFFVVGACIQPHRHVLDHLAARRRVLLSAGALLVVVNLLLLLWATRNQATVTLATGPTLDAHQALLATVGALASWHLALGLVGFFFHNFSSPSGTWRYLADASYWVYLVHHPVAIAFAGLLGPWDTWALLKCLCTVTLTAVVSLATYQVLVRPTWVGQWLNGRRHAPLAIPR